MKLHLGCGKRNFPGWTNVDLMDLPHIHFNSSVDDLTMFDTCSADIIYSSHTLEYFDRLAVKKVLIEWKRVLKKEGILRVSVPNIDALIAVYEKTGDLEKILGPLYGKMKISDNQTDNYIFHKTVYNFDNMCTLLETVGFKDVQLYDWRNTDTSDYDDHSQAYFPHMDKENGLLISLNIQATK